MLALLNDPDPKVPEYLLLFSFSSDDNKQRFLELVQSNELTKTESEEVLVPTDDEIRDARPLGMVLDENITRHGTLIARTVAAAMEAESERAN